MATAQPITNLAAEASRPDPSERWLRRAAGLALLHGLAWLVVPWWLFAHARPWQLTAATRVTGVVLCAIDGACAVVITLVLGRLLRERFRFHRVQRYIRGLAVAYSVGALLGMLGFFMQFHFYFVVLVYTAPTALLLASLGIGLLHLPDVRSRYIRPFACVQIGTGILMASFYFSGLAPLCGAAGGILLMLLFLEQATRSVAAEVGAAPII